MLRHVLRSPMPAVLLVAAGLLSPGAPARGGVTQTNPAPPPLTLYSGNDAISQWLNEVTRIQSEQPSWVTPVVTVTPRLEQEFRYDQFWESAPRNRDTNSYGGGKGFEFIPCDNVEVILGVPAYQTHGTPNANTGGFADENLLVKYRILSANKDNGNYILTAFLGFTVPSGDPYNSGDHEVTTPTIAFGKGWGNFDFQSTLGVSIPDDGAAHAGPGTPLLWNTALQYQVFPRIWPEVEFNYTYWANGSRAYIQQLYVTPGIVLGRFAIDKRFGCTIGAGEQIALTGRAQNNHNTILTVRFPF